MPTDDGVPWLLQRKAQTRAMVSMLLTPIVQSSVFKTAKKPQSQERVLPKPPKLKPPKPAAKGKGKAKGKRNARRGSPKAVTKPPKPVGMQENDKRKRDEAEVFEDEVQFDDGTSRQTTVLDDLLNCINYTLEGLT